MCLWTHIYGIRNWLDLLSKEGNHDLGYSQHLQKSSKKGKTLINMVQPTRAVNWFVPCTVQVCKYLSEHRFLFSALVWEKRSYVAMVSEHPSGTSSLTWPQPLVEQGVASKTIQGHSHQIWSDQVIVVARKHATAGGVRACPPENFWNLEAMRLPLRPFLGQSN